MSGGHIATYVSNPNGKRSSDSNSSLVVLLSKRPKPCGMEFWEILHYYLLSVFMCAARATNAWRAIDVEAAFGYYLPFYFFSGYITNLLSVFSLGK
jgi:hypothetical protein